MGTIEMKLSLYHTMFWCCLILFVLCMAAALTLYFRLDIAHAIRLLRGSAGQTGADVRQKTEKKNDRLCVEREILLIHTNETID